MNINLKFCILNFWQTLFGHNFCRNPDNDELPWCFVSKRKFEYCHVPNCEENKEVSSCPRNLFQCQINECIRSEWVCDRTFDCTNGKDEENCECKDDQFRCSNGKCIRNIFLCDKRNDCTDNGDEAEDRCNDSLKIRLVDGPNKYSGRVEIKRFGVWGTICDDLFDDEDAKVICRSLGYSGPATARLGGTFGVGTGQIWLDELECQGTEKSLEDCPSALWGQNNCNHEEDAGVTCFETSLFKKKEDNYCGIATTFNVTTTDFSAGSDKKRSTGQTHERIIGGWVAPYGTYPWQVDLRIRTTGKKSIHWCGGTILSEFFVVSVAHCFRNFAPSVYIVRVGEYDETLIDKYEDDFEIKYVKIHEHFESGGYLDNDIAMVRIKEKIGHGITFSPYVRPICLPSLNASYAAGTVCAISGWGKNEFTRVSPILMGAEVPIIPTWKCKSETIYGSKIKEGMFCAGHLGGGTDACKGDSGGPMACNENGRHFLYGIISWGFDCAQPDRPGVYVKVSHYLDWIYRILDSDY
ncbi:plasminogen-like [Centruroides vittatus]|uniref:plasminogen-like n=1 Tax=Centruroides vittatus TaxID=120091 RepID=UPI0035101D57